MPYEMPHHYGNPTHGSSGNTIFFEITFHTVYRFGCYASRLIFIVKSEAEFVSRLKNSIVVEYALHSEILWKIWEPAFQQDKVKSQFIINEEYNVNMLCQPGSNELIMFKIPDDETYIEETYTRDEPL